MKVNAVLSFAIGLASFASGAIITPSGKEVPAYLANYLKCPNDELGCKNSQSGYCNYNYNDCKTNMSKEYLSKRGHQLGNLSASEYCNIHKEVCQMTTTYNPIVTPSGQVVPESLFRFLKCDKDKRMCKIAQSKNCSNNKKMSCDSTDNTPIEGLSPEKFCKINTEVCNMIDTFFHVSLPSGAYIPATLFKYFNCTLHDDYCISKRQSECMRDYEDLNRNLSKSYFTRKGHSTGPLTAKQYVNLLRETCDAISTVEPSITFDDVNNINKYYVCEKGDYFCRMSKYKACKAVVDKCWDQYERRSCEKLESNCNKIVSA
eukprot:jgi/Orpsp1_1/1175419/evm.model.c7180000053765.1